MRLSWDIDNEKLIIVIVDLFRHNVGLPPEHRQMNILVNAIKDQGIKLSVNLVIDDSDTNSHRKEFERGYAKAFLDIFETLNTIRSQHVK